MAELHEYPFTQYEDCSLGCFMGLCKRVGVKLAVVGDSLQLLDRNNFILSQVKIYQATVALQDEEGHDLTAYIINAGVRDEHVVFTKGNGDQIVIDVPKAEVAEKDSEGNDITSYLMNMIVSGDKLHVTRGDGSSFEVTVPFAVKAATTVDDIPLTALAASMEVSGQNIILKDSRDNVISTIRCAWSDRAQSDENGNNIRENYGSALQAGTTTIKLISKSGDVLSEITVPYSTTSTYSPSGAEFDAEFGAHLVIDADGKSVDLTAQNGQLLNKIIVPFSTLATDATNAIERAEINGDQLVLTTFGGTVIRLTCPYSVRSLKDNASNVITTHYAHSMTQDPVTGKITLWDAEGNALSELVPTANVAQYDTYSNLIADYIKTLVFDNQSDYLVATHGDGTVDSIVVGYSTKAYKDLRNNAIHDTYIAFVTNVIDGDGEWVMIFYNGEGAEKFRLKVVANKAQKDAAGNIITEFYVHSLTISGDTISFNDANGTAIGSITLPKYVAGMEWEYPSESFWYRTYDVDGNTLQRIKFPIQDWLRLGLVNTDQIQLQDFDNEELRIGRCTVHLPEYYYDAAISGTNLLLKDIHGNTRTTLALPGSSDTAEYDLNEDTLFRIKQGMGNCYYADASASMTLYQAIVPEVHNYKDANGYIRARAIFARPYLQTLGIYKEYSVSSSVSPAAGEISKVSYNTTPIVDSNPFSHLRPTKIGSRDYHGFVDFPASVGPNTIYYSTLPSLWYLKSNPNNNCLLSIPFGEGVAILGSNSVSAGDSILCVKNVPLLGGLLDFQLYNDVECQHVIYGQHAHYTEDANHNMFIQGIVHATRVTVSVLNDTTGAVIRSRTPSINGGSFLLQAKAKASGESEMVQLTFMNDNAPSNIQEKMKVTCYLQMPSGYTAA